jgi:hypothetical protein
LPRNETSFLNLNHGYARPFVLAGGSRDAAANQMRADQTLSETANRANFTRPFRVNRSNEALGRNNVMNRRSFALTLGLSIAIFLAPGLALAEDHLAEAISHTREAIEHGKMGHADVLVTHAEAGLKHAEAAEKAKANAHTKEGITHLKAAISEGKKKNAEAATGHAEEALTHLEAATK